MARQSIGQFLATLRRAHGYTQQEVADKLDVSNRAVSTWERDSAMPDILLLPVIAELYGVTVDEILNGARMERNGDLPTLSQKSETALLRKKLSRFTIQVFILLGVFFSGLLVLFFGLYAWEIRENPLLSYRPPISDRWELIPIAIGVVMLIASMTSFVAIWAHAETSVNDTLKKKKDYCILVRRLVIACLRIAGVLSIVLGVLGVIFVVTNDYYFVQFVQMIPFLITYLTLGISFLIAGLFVDWRTVRKFGDDTMRQQVKENRKLSLKISLWGLIPLAISIVLVVVFSFVQPKSYRIHYQNTDSEEFREHMETLHVPPYASVIQDGLSAGDYRLNLSELAKTATVGQEIDLGNGLSVKFLNGPYDCVVIYRYGESSRYYYCMRHKVDGFTVYDLYYQYSSPTDGESSYNGIFARVTTKTVVEERNGSMVFATKYSYDMSVMFYIVGSFIALIDISVCIAIYYCKRETTEIKL